MKNELWNGFLFKGLFAFHVKGFLVGLFQKRKKCPTLTVAFVFCFSRPLKLMKFHKILQPTTEVLSFQLFQKRLSTSWEHNMLLINVPKSYFFKTKDWKCSWNDTLHCYQFEPCKQCQLALSFLGIFFQFLNFFLSQILKICRESNWEELLISKCNPGGTFLEKRRYFSGIAA